MTELQHNVIVPRDHEVSAFLPHLRSLVLSTNHTYEDFHMHATVIRIKFYQNLICTQQQSNIAAEAIHLFLTAERITSRIVQPFEESRVEENRRELYCIQYKRGGLCENKTTVQSLTVIDQVFLNHSYGFTSQQLDTSISIKMRGDQTCLALCTLDIFILASLKLTLNAYDVHHYVWKQVKSLMWRVTPTNAGFRLRINKTCSAVCTHYCDTWIKLTYHNLYKSKDDCLHGSGFHTNISDIKKGSWNDTASFCEKQGLQLLSPDVAEKEEHDFSSLSCKIRTHLDGYDLMGQAFFAGLYKLMKVTDIIDSHAHKCKTHHKRSLNNKPQYQKYCNQSFSSAACCCSKMIKLSCIER